MISTAESLSSRKELQSARTSSSRSPERIQACLHDKEEAEEVAAAAVAAGEAAGWLLVPSEPASARNAARPLRTNAVSPVTNRNARPAAL